MTNNAASHNYSSLRDVRAAPDTLILTLIFLLGGKGGGRGGKGGGWAGASEGRVISNFFTNWEGSNLFYSQPGEGHSFF